LHPDRETILLRVFERQPKSFVIPNQAESLTRNLLLVFAGSSPVPAPKPFLMWKSSGNPVGCAD